MTDTVIGSFKLKPEVKAMWVAALRSEEYKQGRGALQRLGGEFCCKGVLADLYIKDQKDGSWDHNIFANVALTGLKGTPNIKYETYLPLKVYKWACASPTDLAALNVVRGPDTLIGLSLAQLNDNGTSFASIADIIEREF